MKSAVINDSMLKKKKRWESHLLQFRKTIFPKNTKEIKAEIGMYGFKSIRIQSLQILNNLLVNNN
jgi:hypothetical protein